MFCKKLLAFVTAGVVSSWILIWRGDSLNQLSKVDFDYFKSFYGKKNLSFLSEYVFDDESEYVFDYLDDVF